MEWADLVSVPACLMRQTLKMVNFIRKTISDYMEPSRPFVILEKPSKQDDPLRQPIKRDRMLF